MLKIPQSGTLCVHVKEMSTNSVVLDEEAAKESEGGSIGTEIINIKSEEDDTQTSISVKLEIEPEPSSPEFDPEYEPPSRSVAYAVNAFPFEVDVKAEPLDYDDNGMIHEQCYDQPQSSNKGYPNDIYRYATNGKHTCPICHKGFANSANVQRHLNLHSRTKVTCKLCDRQFTNNEQLDKHVLIKHSEVRKYPCTECGKIFKSSSNLQQHRRVHLTVKPFRCENCHRTFSIRANLVRHQSKTRCKRPVDQPITCHVCHKVFPKEFLLKSHLRRHDTEKPFYCDHCQMNFKYKSTLIRHIQIHNGLKPFSCNICDKTFTHMGLIKPHMRTHTGEKPYKCTFCSKYFAHKHNMQRHALRHNIIKNLVCDVCNKKFPKESRLRYHMKIHVSQKHFSCFICPKQFSHRQNILRHYTRKHPGETYDCKETDASVASKVWEAVTKNKLILTGRESPEEILP